MPPLLTPKSTMRSTRSKNLQNRRQWTDTIRANFADIWFQLLETIIHPEIHKNNKKSVRIVILNTDIDKAHSIIQAALDKKRIVAYKNFSNCLQSLTDRHDHETHDASVLLRTTLNASIYITRMTDDDRILNMMNEYNNIANANALSLALLIIKQYIERSKIGFTSFQCSLKWEKRLSL